MIDCMLYMYIDPYIFLIEAWDLNLAYKKNIIKAKGLFSGSFDHTIMKIEHVYFVLGFHSIYINKRDVYGFCLVSFDYNQ